jgi:hypothetical protein
MAAAVVSVDLEADLEAAVALVAVVGFGFY